ncbi:MAG: hypothetical protein ACRDPR_21975, partial [Nocardioidaceae bacterium]
MDLEGELVPLLVEDGAFLGIGRDLLAQPLELDEDSVEVGDDTAAILTQGIALRPEGGSRGLDGRGGVTSLHRRELGVLQCLCELCDDEGGGRCRRCDPR